MNTTFDRTTDLALELCEDALRRKLAFGERVHSFDWCITTTATPIMTPTGPQMSIAYLALVVVALHARTFGENVNHAHIVDFDKGITKDGIDEAVHVCLEGCRAQLAQQAASLPQFDLSKIGGKSS